MTTDNSNSNNPDDKLMEVNNPEANLPPPEVPQYKVSRDGDVQTEKGEVDDGSDDHLAERWQIKEHGLLVKVFLLIVALVAIYLILVAWRLVPWGSDIERTNNAYVHGRTTVISPQANGYVTHIYVTDFDKVQAGQLLVTIDDRLYRNMVDQAEAQLAAAEAQLINSLQQEESAKARIVAARAAVSGAEANYERALADFKRAEELIVDGSISKREYDMTYAGKEQAASALKQAKAQVQVAIEALESIIVARAAQQAAVEGARATVQNAEINLSYTKIYAPVSGTISTVDVKLGQLVSAGTPLFYLVPEELWVVANLKEVQTHDLEEGQKVTMTVDALDDASVHGRVARIAPATGSEFSVSSPDRAAGNFVKVPQRISVRIELDPSQDHIDKLRPGMSVVAEFDKAERIKPYDNEPPARNGELAPDQNAQSQDAQYNEYRP